MLCITVKFSIYVNVFLFTEGGPSPSLSKLNPFNVTSWTVDDVTQWLVSEGLGQFVEVCGAV